MIGDSLPDEILKHTGFVTAPAAVIASALRLGELIYPFAVLVKGEARQFIEFEAKTQEEVVNQGLDNSKKYKEYFDLCAFGREGSIKSENGKSDALVVVAA